MVSIHFMFFRAFRHSLLPVKGQGGGLVHQKCFRNRCAGKGSSSFGGAFAARAAVESQRCHLILVGLLAAYGVGKALGEF